MKTVLVVLFLTSSHVVSQEPVAFPAIPDREGFAGSFAGVSHGALLVAGGANFPEKKPWEGGKKVWTDTVFVLNDPQGKWNVAGKLPRPLGYGISATYGNRVICVGGSDATQHYSHAFQLEWKNQRLITTNLPSLPQPLANACGVMVGDVLYIAGGQWKPDGASTTQTAWTMDLAAQEPRWTKIENCPGKARMLAVAASFQGSFWVVGGTELVPGKGELVERRYLRDAYRYQPGKGWSRMEDLPYSVVAAPSPAPHDPKGFYVLGGDDGAQIGVDPEKHRGFRKTILRFDTKTEKWTEAGDWSQPRVTVPCVFWNQVWVIPSGEQRPGVRSPTVWGFVPKK